MGVPFGLSGGAEINKDKKDDALRNELKDRLYTTLSENTNRLRQLEQRQDEMVSHTHILYSLTKIYQLGLLGAKIG